MESIVYVAELICLLIWLKCAHNTHIRPERNHFYKCSVLGLNII